MPQLRSDLPPPFLITISGTPRCWPRTWPHSMFFWVAESRRVSELVGCKPIMSRVALLSTVPQCGSNDSRNT